MKTVHWRGRSASGKLLYLGRSGPSNFLRAVHFYNRFCRPLLGIPFGQQSWPMALALVSSACPLVLPLGLDICLPLAGLLERRFVLSAGLFLLARTRARAFNRSSLLIVSQPRTPWRRAISASSFFVRSVSGLMLIVGTLICRALGAAAIPCRARHAALRGCHGTVMGRSSRARLPLKRICSRSPARRGVCDRRSTLPADTTIPAILSARANLWPCPNTVLRSYSSSLLCTTYSQVTNLYNHDRIS